MWARLKRLFRSIFGGMIANKEDPRLILEQNIRDMRDKIPEMNEGLVKARANIIRIENKAKSIEDDINTLRSKIKACINSGEEDLGAEYAIQLKRAMESADKNKQNFETAQSGYEHMVALKEKFLQEMKAKSDEAMRAIQEAEAAKWKKELADVFESFSVAGIDATHQEMIDKLREETADSEARLAMAKDGVDIERHEAEKHASMEEGKELLEQFKIEMGLVEPQKPLAESEEQKTIGPGQKETAKETE